MKLFFYIITLYFKVLFILEVSIQFALKRSTRPDNKIPFALRRITQPENKIQFVSKQITQPHKAHI